MYFGGFRIPFVSGPEGAEVCAQYTQCGSPLRGRKPSKRGFGEVWGEGLGVRQKIKRQRGLVRDFGICGICGANDESLSFYPFSALRVTRPPWAPFAEQIVFDALESPSGPNCQPKKVCTNDPQLPMPWLPHGWPVGPSYSHFVVSRIPTPWSSLHGLFERGM